MASGTPTSGQARPMRRGDLACSAQLAQGCRGPPGGAGRRAWPAAAAGTGSTQRAEAPAGSGPRGAFAASDNQRPRRRECQPQTGLATPRVIWAGTGWRPAVIPACVSVLGQRRRIAPPRWPGCARGRRLGRVAARRARRPRPARRTPGHHRPGDLLTRSTTPGPRQPWPGSRCPQSAGNCGTRACTSAWPGSPTATSSLGRS
jgi:hypothetical protein